MESQKTLNCQSSGEVKRTKLEVSVLPDFRLCYKDTVVKIV